MELDVLSKIQSWHKLVIEYSCVEPICPNEASQQLKPQKPMYKEQGGGKCSFKRKNCLGHGATQLWRKHNPVN